MTGDEAMPSGTLESPLSTSRVRALARTSTLHQDAEKTGVGISYARTCLFIFVQCVLMSPCMPDFFPIGDSGSPTHKVLGSRLRSATVVSLTQGNSS